MYDLKIRIFDQKKQRYLTKEEQKNILYDFFTKNFYLKNKNKISLIENEKYRIELFTGQIDVDGVEIYENDKIIFTENKILGIVRFNTSISSFIIEINVNDDLFYTDSLIAEDYKKVIFE